MERKGARRIRSLREARDLKRQDLAVRFGVDPSTIWRWETGKGEIDDDTKRALSDFFEVTVDHLMGWDTEPATGKAA